MHALLLSKHSRSAVLQQAEIPSQMNFSVIHKDLEYPSFAEYHSKVTSLKVDFQLVEPISIGVTILIRLIVSFACDVKASQPCSTASPGIDAGCMWPAFWNSIFL